MVPMVAMVAMVMVMVMVMVVFVAVVIGMGDSGHGEAGLVARGPIICQWQHALSILRTQ